jgi:seryl-tRNA synthetase
MEDRMSEENKPVVDETVSEDTTNEVSTDSTDVGALIAESKKYRKRSQDAEAERDALKSQLAKAEEAKLKEKEDFKTLYEKTAGEMETYKAQADKWTSYETAKREALLDSIPEEERETMSKLDLETLEFVTSKINNAKANAPEVAGVSRQPEKPIGDWTKMSADDLRSNWEDIVKSAEAKMKK